MVLEKTRGIFYPRQPQRLVSPDVPACCARPAAPSAKDKQLTEGRVLTGRRIVFHLGLPKTGSTTIQETLRINSDRLAEAGIVVSARDGLTRSLRKAALARARQDTWLARLWYRVALRLFAWRVRTRRFQTFLVSDENILGTESATLFSQDGQADFGAVALRMERALGAGFTCHYVIYLRARESWRASAYNQTLKKTKHDKTFSEWCADNTELSGPDRIVARLQAALGDRLTVVAMESELSAEAPLGSAVLTAAGLDESGIAALARPLASNVSLPDAALEFIHVLGKNGVHGRTHRKIARIVNENRHLFATQKMFAAQKKGADLEDRVPANPAAVPQQDAKLQ